MASFFNIIQESGAPTQQADDPWFPSLTYKERLIGFGACSIMGF